MTHPLPALPSRLSSDDVRTSPLAGRVVFSDDPGTADVKTVAFDLFGNGLHLLARNFVLGRDVGGGIAALCDDRTFLLALRHLADTIYAGPTVDRSPGNATVQHLIDALYPEHLSEWVDAPVEAAHPLRLGAAPIFIVGVPRSGTTWLQHMLKAHPAMAGPERETAIFESMRALAANDAVAAAVGREAVAAALRGFAEPLFAGWLSTHAPGATHFIEKTPLHAEHLGLIAAQFPEATVISIHRDGRDVVRSLVEMDHATDDAAKAAARWTDITGKVARSLNRFPGGIDVAYEALLADPVGAVVDLLGRVGLTMDNEVRAEVERRSTERVSQYNTTGDVGSGKWQSLSAREIRAVYRHAGDRLVELGYVSPDELARVRSDTRYRWENLVARVRRS